MIHRSFRFLALGAIALGVLGAVPGAARAERSALFVAGVKASERAGVTKTARATIESAGWTVIEPPLDDGPLADLVTCVGSGLGGDCVPGYLDDHDVDRGVILRISTEGKGGTTKVVTGWVFRRAGELLVTDKRYCQKCEAPAFEASVRELVDALIVAARERARPTLLDVRTIPTGATVKVDGKVAGQADLQVEVYAGVHNVFFELPGYRGESREVVVGDGESMSVEVRLTPADQAPPRGPVRPGAEAGGRGPLPWVVTAGGVALLAGGVTLFALDESAVQDGSQVRQYRDTTNAAIGVTAAGAVATGVGVWLLLRGGHEHGAAPVAAVSPGGGWLGVVGRF